jgi:pimeloyl-ACP methyl ester carboxylesterase
MTTFVLVHGGVHGAWCWQRVIGPLREAGHGVEAVDLPGRGGADTPDVRAYVDVVASAVDRAEPPVLLVGHSLGGIAVSQFVEHRPDAVAGLALVNALLMEDGETAMSKLLTAGEQSFLLRPGALLVSGDGNRIAVAPNLVVDGFYNCCQPADAEWAAARLCFEPFPPMTVPLHITDQGFGSVPKVYFGSRNDHTLPWWFQEKMSKAAEARLVELGGDHSPFLSVPDELVAGLLDIANGVG